jgi:chromosome segregation ATPase
MKTQDFVDTDLVNNGRSSDIAASNGAPRGLVSQGKAELDHRVEQARQQMLELRRQQEDLERERQELEDLRRREEEFEEGKARILEELSRTVTTIEHEEFELNKRGTTLGNFREVYQDYIRQLQEIRENEWTGDELKGQLAKAFAVLDAGRAELNKGRAQLECLGQGPVHLPTEEKEEERVVVAQSNDFNFALEVKRGLARSLPFIIFAALALILVKMMA